MLARTASTTTRKKKKKDLPKESHHHDEDNDANFKAPELPLFARWFKFPHLKVL